MLKRTALRQHVELKAITTKIGSGATPRGGKESYKTEGMPLIRSLNVYDFSFERTDLAFIDEEQARQLDNVTVRKRDILLNITGASVARCCMVPDDLTPARVNQHVAIIRVDESKADARFVFYTINSPRYKNHLLALAQGGATREALTKETIEKFDVELPPLEIQNRISTILSAYDDLIENNTRRIKILEEMAQMLYREWFVNLRFPGHSKVRMVESELGPIPPSWVPGTLNDIVTLQRGFDITKKDQEPGPYSVISSSGPGSTHSAYRVEGPGVVIGRKGTLGTVFYSHRPFWPHDTTLWVKDFHGHPPIFCFYLLKSLVLEQYDCGASNPTINRNHVHRLSTLIPDATTLANFAKHALPLYELQTILDAQATNLRTTRDLLLPRLVSGEIPIEAAEETVGELMDGEIALHA